MGGGERKGVPQCPSFQKARYVRSSVHSQSSGADFFCGEVLLIDCQCDRLVDAYNYTRHKAYVASAGV